MPKLSEEARQRRAAARVLKEALARGEEHLRVERKYEEWRRNGTALTWEKYQAGVRCRGCGMPIKGKGGYTARKGLMHLAPEEKTQHDAEDERYRQQHADCRGHRWSVDGSPINHCGFCCPPPPMSPEQVERLASMLKTFAALPTPDRDLDEWEVTLTCDHVMRRRQHRSSPYFSNLQIIPCDICGVGRAIKFERIGPAVSAEQVAAVERDRLLAELRQAEEKLARCRAAADKVQKHVDELKAREGFQVPALDQGDAADFLGERMAGGAEL
jgi:hypothetical protein